jgi:hypothetical protein
MTNFGYYIYWTTEQRNKFEKKFKRFGSDIKVKRTKIYPWRSSDKCIDCALSKLKAKTNVGDTIYIFNLFHFGLTQTQALRNLMVFLCRKRCNVYIISERKMFHRMDGVDALLTLYPSFRSMNILHQKYQTLKKLYRTSAPMELLQINFNSTKYKNKRRKS